MHAILILLASMALATGDVPASMPAVEGISPRQRQLFDADWRFHASEVAEAFQPNYDDAGWQHVDLPHDYQIAEPFDAKMPDGVSAAFLPHGIGWYRKSFTPPANLEGKQLFLDFEGVYRAADVWINGQHLGRKLNGYIGFQYDITPHVQWGKRNVVAVRCDNTAKDTSRWYTGSGIYRHVWLLSTEPLYVERFGTYVTTPRVSGDSAVVRIATEVRSRCADVRECELLTDILNDNGLIVAAARSVVPVQPGDLFRYDQEFTVDKPTLWSVEVPYLYKAVTRIRERGVVKDIYETPFGIRDIAMSPEQGLSINGRKVFAKGVNIHHDNGCLGAAAFDRAIERRLQVLKDMGCNAVRLSHNPHAPALLDMCDRMGLLVMDEAYDKWTGQYNGWTAPFDQTWRADLLEFLRRDRNHPSVFIWSVGNECVEHQIHGKDHGIAQLRELVDFVHVHEPSRKVTCALYPARADGMVFWEDHKTKGEDKEPTPMTFYMDVTSCNYMQQLFAHDRARYPQLTFLASEVATNGAGRDFFDVDQQYTVGMFYWGGIDYLGEAFGWPNKGWFRGFVDTCGFRKPASYYVQSLYADKPLVHIAVYDAKPGSEVVWNDVKLSWQPMPEHWNWPENTRVRLATFTNCESVELLLNGKSCGTKKLADCKERLMEWVIPFRPGTLTAAGRNNGQVVAIHELKTAGEASRIQLLTDRRVLCADGQDLAHVTVQVTDEHGLVVPSAANKITFKTSGPGSIAGLDNGDLMSNEPFQGNQRSAYHGKALLVVRSASEPGQVVIEAAAEGLAAGRLELPVKQSNLVK